jgi:hypothetical protein
MDDGLSDGDDMRHSWQWSNLIRAELRELLGVR